MKKTLMLFCLIVMMALPAYADQIGLFSTGVAADGSLLPATAIDPHYRISTVVEGIGSTREPISLPNSGNVLQKEIPAFVVYDVPYWVANGPKSQWISPSADTYDAHGMPDSLYTYLVTFDLTGLDPASARITGSWSADDAGWMFLNGQQVAELPFEWMFHQLDGTQVAPNEPSYTANHDFLLAGGFLPGINTIEFFVWNLGGGPTGLRVEVSSATADPQP
jgi:hypothetical protein